MHKFRIETDSLGEIKVPKDCYWGAQTERALHNFSIGNHKMPLSIIYALAVQKRCAALTNARLKLLDHPRAQAIVAACDEIIAGNLDEYFPLSVWQTGSGTQTNMNLNEVIANWTNLHMLLDSPLHPNDHVNMGQSSNDSFPTAMNIATVMGIHKHLIPALKHLLGALETKAQAFHSIVKVGRTHLQDATPITLGQEFSGYAQQIKFALERVAAVLPRLYNIAQGGTAVGTGLNTVVGFDQVFAELLKEYTGLPFTVAPNKFEAMACHDSLVEFSGILNVLAASLLKIANDIRWLVSGPRCGLQELIFPPNEPGSSIMPGKVNPTQAEALIMVAIQVMGNHVTVTIAGSQGNFELNVLKPLIIYNVLESLGLLSDGCQSFTDRCLIGLEANTPQLAYNLTHALMLVTALNPVIGYEKAAAIAKKSLGDNISLEAAAIALGYLTAEQFKELVRPEAMLAPTEV